MIVEALRTGFMEGNGKHYRQPRIEIRPRPKYSFDNRIYAVASSEDSVEAAARLGAHMVMFSDRPWPMRLPAIQRNRELFRKFHGREAPPMLIADFCICWPKQDEAEELARKHMGSFVHSNFEHYELLGDHFNTVKGYDAYAQKAAIAKAAGMDGAIAGFMKAAVWGSPDRILRELETRREVIGEFELDTSFRFGGIPYDTAEKSLKLFAREVLPVLQSWKSDAIATAAAE
jgi:alkanesulfonate monooxygenase SsuD/methylene tetrahydromethanopterin reductase-like flavin-dependent oxidoreductase (luciferase family)